MGNTDGRAKTNRHVEALVKFICRRKNGLRVSEVTGITTLKTQVFPGRGLETNEIEEALHALRQDPRIKVSRDAGQTVYQLKPSAGRRR
jgi:hypothetical protein